MLRALCGLTLAVGVVGAAFDVLAVAVDMALELAILGRLAWPKLEPRTMLPMFMLLLNRFDSVDDDDEDEEEANDEKSDDEVDNGGDVDEQLPIPDVDDEDEDEDDEEDEDEEEEDDDKAFDDVVPFVAFGRDFAFCSCCSCCSCCCCCSCLLLLLSESTS